MSYLRHIDACNAPVSEPFWPWFVEQQVVGWLRPSFATQLAQFPGVFVVSDGRVELHAGLRDFDSRSEALADAAQTLAENGTVVPLLGEPYPITASGREDALCVMDRAAAAFFGARSFGQHLNGFVRDGDELLMWIGRRSRDRRIFPGALDNMVAGGLPYGLGLAENLRKECQEEAGMPAELAGKARAVGAVSYNRVATRGFRPDVLYCYDLEVPADFTPVNTDGEVEEFMLLPLSEVMAIVKGSDEFKSNCNLVLIDFAIRHGVIVPDDEDYLALVGGLRQPLGLPFAAAG